MQDGLASISMKMKLEKSGSLIPWLCFTYRLDNDLEGIVEDWIVASIWIKVVC